MGNPNVKTEREMAEWLRQQLHREQFSNFCDFMDVCDSVEFSAQLAEIDAMEYPEKYVSSNQTVKKEINMNLGPEEETEEEDFESENDSSWYDEEDEADDSWNEEDY